MKNSNIAFAVGVFFGLALGFMVGALNGKAEGIEQTCELHCETTGHDDGKYSHSLRRCVCLDQVEDPNP